MFNEGDVIVCIKPSKSIIYGEEYIVDRICINNKTMLRYYIKLVGLGGAFRNDRFLTAKQTLRLKKINKIVNEYKNI